ncbi:MAG: polysaccharide biosynthesis tyrosine autokinase, partial [Elusimicrobiota bacterium]
MAFLIPVIYYVYNKPDIYISFTEIITSEAKGAFSDFLPNIGKQDIGFYRGIFDSRSFKQLVIDSIGIQHLKPFVKDTTENGYLDLISNSVGFSAGNALGFYRITAFAQDDTLAYLLAQKTTLVFIERCAWVVSSETENMINEIEKNLENLKKNVEKATNEYQMYKDRVGLLSDGVEDEIVQLKGTLLQLKTQRTTLNAQYRSTEAQLAKMEKGLMPKEKNVSKEYLEAKKDLDMKKKEKMRLESMGINVPPASDIYQDIEALEKKLILLRGSEGVANGAGVTAFELSKQWRRLKDLQDKVTSQEVELELLDNKIAFYINEIGRYRELHPEIPQMAAELERLKKQKEITEQTHQNLLDQYYKIKTQILPAEQNKMRISDEARMPTSPQEKNALRFYLIGALLGLIVGVSIAFLLEYLDDTVKTSDDIEQLFDIPVIGTIPHIDYKGAKVLEVDRISSQGSRKLTRSFYPKEILDFYNDESTAAESYRAVRTNLFFASPDNPIKSLVISSSGPHEGKSLTAANLALSCAQAGKRTLLVDTDLRRPVIHNIFHMPREKGFSDIFMDNAVLEDNIKEYKEDKLSVMTSGRFTPNPAELLTSKKIEKMIETFEEKFDMVIFDTPP